jgi:hypothetical protein
MRGTQLDFHVRDGLVQVTEFRQYESRGDCCLELLCDLVVNWPELFEGRTGSVFYGDLPPPDQWADKELNFCTTIRPGHTGPWLPFPCFASLRWAEVGVPDAEAMLEELLTDDREWKSPRIFWIGTNQHPSRHALWELGKRQSGIMDIEMMEWNRADPKSLVSRSRQVSIPDHRDFKYLVDCPGRGYSARLKWLIATGRPVFVVARDIVEPWHTEMVPWVHFVPVAADLSDLLEHHARLEAEPELYEKIGRNAREFAAEKLRVDAQLIHVAEKVREALVSEPSGNPEAAEKTYGDR